MNVEKRLIFVIKIDVDMITSDTRWNEVANSTLRLGW